MHIWQLEESRVGVLRGHRGIFTSDSAPVPFSCLSRVAPNAPVATELHHICYSKAKLFPFSFPPP